jgi:hypothetical protein
LTTELYYYTYDWGYGFNFRILGFGFEWTRGVEMNWEFTLELTGVEDLTTELADSLFLAGCGMQPSASPKGRLWLDFDRESESLEEAVRTAKDDIRKAGERSGFTLDAREVNDED